jgi:hypothetical protein
MGSLLGRQENNDFTKRAGWERNPARLLSHTYRTHDSPGNNNITTVYRADTHHETYAGNICPWFRRRHQEGCREARSIAYTMVGPQVLIKDSDEGGCSSRWTFFASTYPLYSSHLEFPLTLEASRAKKRLSQLQEEIHQEMQNNSEGVSLEMAVQERQWIIDHFGLVDPNATERPAIPPTPQSPRSPIGGRLGEKLRGLKLATSPTDLANSGGKSTFPRPTSCPWQSQAKQKIVLTPKNRPEAPPSVLPLARHVGHRRPVSFGVQVGRCAGGNGPGRGISKRHC